MPDENYLGWHGMLVPLLDVHLTTRRALTICGVRSISNKFNRVFA